MAFTYNLKNDIRYKEGLEIGVGKGIRKATTERNTAFVLYLLKHTDHDDQKISEFVKVPQDFVRKVKEENL